MFTGGPYLATYQAQSSDGAHIGIRCIKFANYLACPTVPGICFAWYGEGSWQQKKYRHFGESMQKPNGASMEITGIAADFYGNGEEIHHFADGLTFAFHSVNSDSIPTSIIVSGTWNEEWILARDNVVQDYTSELGPVMTGGPFFDEFSLEGIWRDGSGIRCKLSNYSWYGAGEWRGDTYAHIATFVGNTEVTPVPDAFGASDICQDTSFCNDVPWGSIILKNADYLGEGSYEVTGVWSEKWLLAHRATRHNNAS